MIIRRNLKLSIILGNIWQQVQKGRGQQSAGGHAQHMLGVTRHEAKAQCSRHPYAADAGDQGTHQYRYQQHSYN